MQHAGTSAPGDMRPQAAGEGSSSSSSGEWLASSGHADSYADGGSTFAAGPMPNSFDSGVGFPTEQQCQLAQQADISTYWSGAAAAQNELPTLLAADRLEPALLARIEASHESAIAQLKEARELREQDVEKFRAETAGGRLTDPLELQRWAGLIAEHDAIIEEAASAVERAEVAMDSATEAFRLNQSAAGQRAQAQQRAEAVRTAQQRLNACNAEAKAAEDAAAAAHMDLVNTLSSENMLQIAAQRRRLSMSPPRSSGQGAAATTTDKSASTAGKSSAEERSFYSLLHSPRTYALRDAAEVRGPSGKVYRSSSIFCLYPGTPPRNWAILLCESKPFDPVILCTILANCATMAWQSPLDPPGTQKAAFIDVCEWVFLAIFTAELVTKVVAYGFLMHKGAYLHDPWCQMDFVVVSLAWLPIIFPSFGNYSVLRAVRALRPLRALKRLPGMPLLIQWILEVLPKLGTVMLLCGFIFLIFGIVGMELFKGALHYRCALPAPSLNLSGARMLKGGSSNLLSSETDAFGRSDTGLVCSPEDPFRCDHSFPGSSCSFFGKNPYAGSESFDSFPLTFVLLMQCITFDEWATPMYDEMAYFSWWTSVYFLLIVVFGGFFVVNLFLAVVFLEFSEAKASVSAENSPASTQRSRRESADSDSEALLTTELRSDHAGVPAPARRSRGCCDCVPQPGSFRYVLMRIATSQALGTFATTLVLLNMVLMCMPYEGMSDEYAASLEYWSGWITWIFIGEMALKLCGLGCSAYWADGWNQLDGTIVTMSIVEIVLTTLLAGSGVKLSFMRMLRMLRVLRVLRLMKSWRGLYYVINTFIKALPQMTNIGILLALAAFIFALLGMTLFGAIFNPDNGYAAEDVTDPCPDGLCADGSLAKPRSHFDYCMPAMLSIFIVLTGEWVDVMRPVTALVGPWSAGFFIAVVVIGKYLLVNLLVAVILSEFGGAKDESEEASDSAPAAAEEKRRQTVSRRLSTLKGDPPKKAEPSVDVSSDCTVDPGWAVSEQFTHGADEFSYNQTSKRAVSAIIQVNGVVQRSGTLAGLQMGDVRGVGSQFVVPLGPLAGQHAWHLEVYVSTFALDEQAAIVTCLFWTGTEIVQLSPSIHIDALHEFNMTDPIVLTAKSSAPPWPSDYSLFCFNRQNRVRRSCKWLIEQSWFQNLIMVCIFISSICLALDTPRLDQDSTLAFYLRRLDLTFTAVFFSEMVLKVICFGFYFAKDAYIKDPWNQMDFLIVLVSIVVLLAEAIPQLRSLRVLRTLRVLRPLRVVSRSTGLKLIITTLFRSLPAVSNVFGVMLALQLVFAILGMQLFSGTMAKCSDPTITTKAECLMDEERSWSNPVMGSFDSFWEAMRLLYVMSSGDGWSAPMYLMMDATEPGHASVRNDFSPAALFSIVWMLVGFVFAQNLVVGVVVDDFSRRHKEESGAGLMTPAQKQWVDAMQATAQRRPQRTVRPPRRLGVRKIAYRIVGGWGFDGFITSVIVANIVVMSSDYFNIEEDLAFYKIYTRANLAFTCVYYIECALKIVALGCDGYFSDPWCRFDFFLVCTSLLEMFATDLLSQYLPLPPMLLRVLRVFRILRILRLLKGAKELRNLIVTVVLSIPSLANVASILSLVIYVYAILGMQLFTFLAPGDIIDDERNFHSIGSSALLIFQCLTGDAWAVYMGDAEVTEASGTCSDAEGTCGSVAAVPYFISFQLIGCFIFLNLFVAVILENFATMHNTDSNLVSAFDLEVFNDAWSQFDPDATNFIPTTQLAHLLLAVPRPLGLKGVTEKLASRMCLRLGLRQHMGMVAYTEVINELIKNNYFRSGTSQGIASTGGRFDEDDFQETAQVIGAAPTALPQAELHLSQINSAKNNEWSALKYEPKFVQTAETVAHVYALKKINKFFDRGCIDRWRLRVLRKKQEELMHGMTLPRRAQLGNIAAVHTALSVPAAPQATSAQALRAPARAPPRLATNSPQSRSIVSRMMRPGAIPS